MIASDPKSAEIIKPIIEGEDVRRYSVNYKYYYIILSKINVPIERYPAVFAHLQQYQSRLEERSDRGKHWWELRACDYYDAFEQPKITWPIIASFNRFTLVEPGYYSNDKTFFIPTNDLYLLAILNSSVMFSYLRSKLTEKRGEFWEYQKDKLVQAPIRRIHYTCPDRERADLTDEGLTLYHSNHYEDLLIFIQACLQHVPEQSDVIHDLLVFLVKQILTANKQRQIALEEFTLGLESVLSNLDVKKLARLWTPPSKTDKDAEKRLSEGWETLGSLVNQQLNLQEHISLFNEEQWKWLIKKRLVKLDLVDLVKIYRKYQPPIARLDQQIATIDDLINQIVEEQLLN